MQPIEEYGKGKGRPYGIKDRETGETYFGRGYVQLTWRENYARQTTSSASTRQPAWNGTPTARWIRTLPVWSCSREWSRGGSVATMPAARRCRAISTTPPTIRSRRAKSSTATSTRFRRGRAASLVGNLIKAYHHNFLDALKAAELGEITPVPVPPQVPAIILSVQVPPGVQFHLVVNGEEV